MAGTSKGSVFRPTVTRSRKGKKVRTKSRLYWAKYRDIRGIENRHALKLPSGDGITDKSVALERLRQMLKRVERESVGLIDPFVESASIPIRVALGRYMRHLRRNELSRRHIKQVLGCLKWMIEQVDMHRLGDLNEEHIDRALGKVAALGRSPRTVNVYRRCAHSFAEWGVKVARLLDRNPVAVIGRRNESADTRKVRRSLAVEEARRLLGVCGPRKLFYAVQLWTGLRVSEVRALKWKDLNLDGPHPSIRLRADATKSKRADELPLHPDLAAMLIEAKPANTGDENGVFGTTPILRTFKRDLERAAILFEDRQGRTVDRHAMRTTFISWLGKYGVDPRAQLMLARHAPQGVTLRNYQDFSVFDLWAEIRKIPGIDEVQPQSLKATGTCPSGGVVPGVVPTGGTKLPRVSISGTQPGIVGPSGTDISRCDGSTKHRLSAYGRLGDTGLEPVTSCVSSRRSS